MEHGPIVHAEREIGRVPAAGVELHVDPSEHPFTVEAAAPVHPEVVTLPGHRHVVVAIETKFRRTSGDVRGKRGEAGPLRRLRFLAAERPAHPPALAHHRRIGRAEHAGDKVLHLRRVLGRGVDPHLVVFAGHSQSRLPLEVEVLLAADAHAAVEPVRGGVNGGGRLPAPELVGGQHLGTDGEALIDGDAGSDRLDVDAGAAGRAPGRVAGLGDDREDHLPVKEDLAGREDRIIVEGGAAIIHAGNVRGGQHRQYSG